MRNIIKSLNKLDLESSLKSKILGYIENILEEFIGSPEIECDVEETKEAIELRLCICTDSMFYSMTGYFIDIELPFKNKESNLTMYKCYYNSITAEVNRHPVMIYRELDKIEPEHAIKDMKSIK